MNKKQYILFTLLLFLLRPLPLQAQNKITTKKIPAWQVDYNLYFREDTGNVPTSPKDSVAEMTSRIMKALIQNDDGPILLCYITDQKIRVEQKGMMSYTTLVDKRDTAYYVLDTSFETAYRKRSNIETTYSGNSIIVIDPEDFEVTFDKERKKILGYSCKKAVFFNPALPKATIVAWYTEEIPVLYWGKYTYLKKLQGCVLLLYTRAEHKKVGITAHQIRKVDVSPSIFEVPENYKIEDAF